MLAILLALTLQVAPALGHLPAAPLEPSGASRGWPQARRGPAGATYPLPRAPDALGTVALDTLRESVRITLFCGAYTFFITIFTTMTISLYFCFAESILEVCSACYLGPEAEATE